jgi:hypothetical protein
MMEDDIDELGYVHRKAETSKTGKHVRGLRSLITSHSPSAYSGGCCLKSA